MKIRPIKSLPLLSILLLALLVRLPLLNGSFWLDEAAQALESTRPWHQQLNIAYDFQPPLLHILLHIVQYVSHQEWWLRLFGALIPGLTSIYFSLKIARERFGLTNMIWLGLFLSLNSLHIFYSQELRPYALPAAFAAWSWWLILRKQKQQSVAHYVQIAVVTAWGSYSSYLYPLVPLSQLLWIWLQKKDYKKRVIASGSSLIAGAGTLVVWLPKFWEQLQVGGMLRQNLPGWEEVVSIPYLKAILLVPLKFVFGVIDVSPQSVFWLSLGSLVLVSLLVFTQSIKHPFQTIISLFLQKISNTISLLLKRDHKPWLLGLIWFGVPFLASLVISLWIPVVRPKRLLFTMPGFFLLLMHAPMMRTKPWFRSILLGSLLLIQVMGLSEYWVNPQLQRENWQSLVVNLEQRFPENTLVIFAFEDPFAPWRWYSSNAITTYASGYLTNEAAIETAQSELKIATEYQYVLVFDYLRDLSDPDNMIPTTLTELGLKESSVIDTPNIGFVRVYSLPEFVIGQK